MFIYFSIICLFFPFIWISQLTRIWDNIIIDWWYWSFTTYRIDLVFVCFIYFLVDFVRDSIVKLDILRSRWSMLRFSVFTAGWVDRLKYYLRFYSLLLELKIIFLLFIWATEDNISHKIIIFHWIMSFKMIIIYYYNSNILSSILGGSSCLGS